MSHLFAAFADGYHGLRRGGKQAVIEYDRAGLGAYTLSFLGNKAKPLLVSFALRATPLPVGEDRPRR